MRVHTPQRLAKTLMPKVPDNQSDKSFAGPREQFIDIEAAKQLGCSEAFKPATAHSPLMSEELRL